MRGLFLALLFANVAFFGWAHWIDVPPTAQAAEPAPALPLLALAGPGDAAITAVAVTAMPAGSPAQDAQGAQAARVASARCRSLGPFPDAAAASTIAGVLRARKLSVHSRTVDITLAGGTVSAYWLDVDLVAGEPDPPLAALRRARAAAGSARLTARVAAALRSVAFSDCPVPSSGG